MPSRPAGFISIYTPDALLFIDGGEHYADEDDVQATVQAFVEKHADEIAERIQARVDERRADYFEEPEDESSASYTSYEEGRALDEYEHSHGW